MKTIHHVVDVDANPEALFDAITTQEGLSGWWTTQVEVSGPDAGSIIDFTFAGDFNPDMEISAIQPPHAVEWRCVGGHVPWKDNTFRFEIEPLEAGRSRLRFWQHYAVELSDDEYGIYNYNWGYYLQSLYELVTTGRGKPFAL